MGPCTANARRPTVVSRCWGTTSSRCRPHVMRHGQCNDTVSVCLTVCMSHFVLRRVCCCGPGGRAMSIDCCTARLCSRRGRLSVDIHSSTALSPLSDVGRRPLRSNSNDMRKLLVPRTHNKLGDRSFFSAAGPRLWNDLPPGLRMPGLTFDSFRRSLKTHLFGGRSA